MLRLLVIAALWLLFATSDHGDNALSIAIGGTVAIWMLTTAELVWKLLWRLLQPSDGSGRRNPKEDPHV